MHPATLEAQQHFDLRLQAATRLAAGIKGAALSASNALAVLHDLASSPATAGDALALLHELQVHQVELDLQADELRQSRFELESALLRQIQLYDAQPVGCFTIDHSLRVYELNLTGARMLGLGRDEVTGLPLDSFLTPNSGRTLRELVSRTESGASNESATVQLISKGGLARAVRAHLSADPAGNRFLVVLADADPQLAAGEAS